MAESQPDAAVRVCAYAAIRINCPPILGAIRSKENRRSKQLRLLLIIANAAAIAVLLAIPIGKLYGFVEEEVGAAAVFGWLIFLFPCSLPLLRYAVFPSLEQR